LFGAFKCRAAGLCPARSPWCASFPPDDEEGEVLVGVDVDLAAFRIADRSERGPLWQRYADQEARGVASQQGVVERLRAQI
jgi:hypothetical protein